MDSSTRLGRGRVLLVTPDFPPSYGGIQLLMDRLIRNWGRVDAHVVTFNGPGAREFDRNGQVPTRRVRSVGGARVQAAVLNGAALKIVRSLRPDIILSAHVIVSPASRAAKRLFGIPYVQYLHGVEVTRRRSLSAAAVQCADAVIAVSSHTAALAAARGAARERIYTIPNGVDLPRRRVGPRFEQPTIAVVSRLDERYKGHDVLIRALPLVRARVPGARLIVIGNGDFRPFYETLAASLDLGEHVDFVGEADDETRDQILERSHVFAMPSRLTASGGGEGFGIAYLEAAARGLPVVAGNVGGAPDAVVHGATGLLVDPTDHVAVADAIIQLLLDPATAARLGRAGAARAEDFAWPKIAARVEDLLLVTARQALASRVQ